MKRKLSIAVEASIYHLFNFANPEVPNEVVLRANQGRKFCQCLRLGVVVVEGVVVVSSVVEITVVVSILVVFSISAVKNKTYGIFIWSCNYS